MLIVYSIRWKKNQIPPEIYVFELCMLLLNANFNNISSIWGSVLLFGETGVTNGNNRPVKTLIEYTLPLVWNRNNSFSSVHVDGVMGHGA